MDIYKFLVAVVDIIGSSSHKNLVTWIFQLPRHGRAREVLKVGDLAVKKSWSDQNLSEFSKVNLIGQI